MNENIEIERHSDFVIARIGERYIKMTENGIEVYYYGKKIVEATKDGDIIVPSGVTVCGHRPKNPSLTEALNFALLAIEYGEEQE